jgi:hypothetical protein
MSYGCGAADWGPEVSLRHCVGDRRGDSTPHGAWSSASQGAGHRTPFRGRRARTRNPPIRPGTCLELSSQCGDPFPHAKQPLAAAGPVVRSAVVAVVVDLHGEVVVPVGDAHRRGGRPGMAGWRWSAPPARGETRPGRHRPAARAPRPGFRFGPPGPPYAPARPAHPAGRVSRWAIGAGAAGEEGRAASGARRARGCWPGGSRPGNYGPGQVGPGSGAAPTPACTLIRDRWWPSASWSSLAMRKRSSLTRLRASSAPAEGTAGAGPGLIGAPGCGR